MKLKVIGLITAISLSVMCAPTSSATTSAPTLPANQKLMGIEGDYMYVNGRATDHRGQLWEIATTSDAKPVGSTGLSAGTSLSISNAALDPTDNKFYALNQIDNSHYDIRVIDPVSGNISTGTAITGFTGTDYSQLIIDKTGSFYLLGDTLFYALNKSTGAATSIGTYRSSSDQIPWASGYDIKNDTMYVITATRYSGRTPLINTINKTTGTLTQLTTPTWPEANFPTNTGHETVIPIGSMAFDSNGIAWISDDWAMSGLIAWNPATNDVWAMPIIVDANQTLHTNSQSTPKDLLYTTALFIYTSAVNSTPVTNATTAIKIAKTKKFNKSGVLSAVSMRYLTKINSKRGDRIAFSLYSGSAANVTAKKTTMKFKKAGTYVVEVKVTRKSGELITKYLEVIVQ